MTSIISAAGNSLSCWHIMNNCQQNEQAESQWMTERRTETSSSNLQLPISIAQLVTAVTTVAPHTQTSVILQNFIHSQSNIAFTTAMSLGNYNLHFDGCFPREPGLAGPSVVFLRLSWNRTFVDTLLVGCPSCHPTNSVKTLKETQSTCLN